MKKFIIFLTVILFIGCEQGIEKPGKPNAKLVYFKDDSTELCFAKYTSATYGYFHVVSITNVPCEKVEKFINK